MKNGIHPLAINSAQGKQVVKLLSQTLSENSAPERLLYVEVIIQAVRDLSRAPVKGSPHSFSNAAYAWLYGKSDDFYRVCDLADINAEYLHLIIKQAKMGVTV